MRERKRERVSKRKREREGELGEGVRAWRLRGRGRVRRMGRAGEGEIKGTNLYTFSSCQITVDGKRLLIVVMLGDATAEKFYPCQLVPPRPSLPHRPLC